MNASHRNGRCAISGETTARRDLIAVGHLRPTLGDRLKRDYPQIGDQDLIQRRIVGLYRAKLVEELLAEERGELTELEHRVAASLARHETIAKNVDDAFLEARSFGERLSDHIASFGGSWTFILSFFVLLSAWIGLNSLPADRAGFDPYPFILLNLVLSCLAAIQAPIIMMSQKRQEAKDRERSRNDYLVNLKAELEIRHIDEKLDHLINRQLDRIALIERLEANALIDDGADMDIPDTAEKRA